jgi:hypothetical protein
MSALEQLRVKAGRNPRAKKPSQLVTIKQMTAMVKISASQGRDVFQEVKDLFGCELEQLSKWAASAMIDYLGATEKPGGDNEHGNTN